MVPRLPVSAAAVRPGTTQFSYPRYGGTTPYPGADSPYSDADADKKLSALCRRRSSWKCAALVLLLVVLALAALVAYLLGTPLTWLMRVAVMAEWLARYANRHLLWLAAWRSG